MEEIEKAALDILEKDIIELVKKHGISGVSFTGTGRGGKGIMLFSVDNQYFNGQCFDAAMNV